MLSPVTNNILTLSMIETYYHSAKMWLFWEKVAHSFIIISKGLQLHKNIQQSSYQSKQEPDLPSGNLRWLHQGSHSKNPYYFTVESQLNNLSKTLIFDEFSL